MFFIVLGHVCKANYETDSLRIFCYSFNAQAFFFISGLTLFGVNRLELTQIKSINFVQEIKRWGRRLIRPYLIWGSISIIVYVIIEEISSGNGFSSIKYYFLAMLFGNSTSEFFKWNRPLWFLPCLFVLLCLAGCILWVCSRFKRTVFYGLVLVCLIISFVFSSIIDFSMASRYNYWHWMTAIAMFPMIIFGFVYKELYSKVNRKSRLVNGAAAILLLIMSVLLGSNSVYTDLRQGCFHGYTRFISVSVLLSLSVILFSQAIKKCDSLEYIGKHTMEILVLHKFPILFFQLFCPVVKDYLASGSILFEFICTIVSIIVAVFTSKMIDKLLKFNMF